MLRVKTEWETLSCFQTTKIFFMSLWLSWQIKEGRDLVRSLESTRSFSKQWSTWLEESVGAEIWIALIRIQAIQTQHLFFHIAQHTGWNSVAYLCIGLKKMTVMACFGLQSLCLIFLKAILLHCSGLYLGMLKSIFVLLQKSERVSE